MKYFLLITGLSIFLNLPLIVKGQSFNNGQDGEKWLNVDYSGDGITGHRLDIHLPGRKGSYPVAILIYGSAWFSNNSKTDAYKIMGKPLLDGGFAVIAVNHRSSKEAKFPAQINDLKAAVRFIRANADKYKLDTTFIGVTGYSSGGHLSALLGTSGNVNMFSVKGVEMSIEGNTGSFFNFKSNVDAIVDWYGPADFIAMDSCGSSFSHNAPESPESSLVGGPIQQNYARCALANPVTYLDPYDPPFLILHGDKDPLVPHCQSIILFEELRAKGVKSKLIIVPNGQHGPGLHEPEYFKMMVEFFREEKKLGKER